MARNKSSQSKHDTKVSEIAKEFESKGYKVNADIIGYSRPKTIRGYRPDVIAKKGKLTKIVEIETSDSKGSKRDLKQMAAFRKEANSNKHITFRRNVTD